MEIKQIYPLVNDALKETLGESVILNEDLSNLVDAGDAVFNANSFDKFSGKLVDKVGKVVFVDRKYSGVLGSVLRRDGWEYGAVLQKISSSIPQATVNETYELTDGASYDPNIFHKPDVAVKFYNKYVTFEIDRSITEKQLKSAFTGPAEMNAFISMLYNEVDKALTIATEDLSRRTINNMIAETLYDEYNSGTVFTGASHNRAVNLLFLYNSGPNAGGTALTAAAALTDPEFIRFASYMIGLYSDRIAEISTLFNGGAQQRFTPKDKQTVLMLSEFRRAADSYLQAGTFHDEFTRLPDAKAVSFWQGSGTGYAFADTSAVKATTTGGNAVTASGILCVMFDYDAAGINSMERWVRTNPNPKADFTNYFYKEKVQYYNDFNENFVVFFIA